MFTGSDDERSDAEVTLSPPRRDTSLTRPLHFLKHFGQCLRLTAVKLQNQCWLSDAGKKKKVLLLSQTFQLLTALAVSFSLRFQGVGEERPLKVQLPLSTWRPELTPCPVAPRAPRWAVLVLQCS